MAQLAYYPPKCILLLLSSHDRRFLIHGVIPDAEVQLVLEAGLDDIQTASLMMQFPQLSLVVIQDVLLDYHSPSLFLLLADHQAFLTSHAQEHPLVLSEFYQLPALVAPGVHRELTNRNSSLNRGTRDVQVQA